MGGKSNEQWNNDHISDHKIHIDKVDAQEQMLKNTHAKTLRREGWVERAMNNGTMRIYQIIKSILTRSIRRNKCEKHSRKDAKTRRMGGKSNEQWNNEQIPDPKFQIDKVDAQEQMRKAFTQTQRKGNHKDTKTQKRRIIADT